MFRAIIFFFYYGGKDIKFLIAPHKNFKIFLNRALLSKKSVFLPRQKKRARRFADRLKQTAPGFCFNFPGAFFCPSAKAKKNGRLVASRHKQSTKCGLFVFALSLFGSCFCHFLAGYFVIFGVADFYFDSFHTL